MKNYEELDTFIQKEKDIRSRFSVAKEMAEKEVAEYTEAIAKGEAESKENYTMFVLGDITEESFNEINADMTKLKASLQSSNKKLADIEGLLKDELEKEVLNPLHANRHTYAKLNSDNADKQRMKVLQAKADYIAVIYEARKEIDVTNRYASYMEQVGMDLGHSQRFYGFGQNKVNFLMENFYNGKAGATVSEEELTMAYNSGELHRWMKDEIK